MEVLLQQLVGKVPMGITVQFLVLLLTTEAEVLEAHKVVLL